MADVLDIDNAEDFEVDDDGDRKFLNVFRAISGKQILTLF